MEEAEPSRYVTQLRAEFDSCDSTATGFLDREELTELSRKLQLDAYLPLLLDTLLGERPHGRVNFEEFKNGLVVVLSHSLDFSTSEDDSSYLVPAIPQEVKPKFVKGAKRYGRRSRPETQSSTSLDSTPTRTKPMDLNLDSSPPGVHRAKLRRSTSLESVESLKSDEETGSSRLDQQLFHNKDQQQDAGGRAGGCDVAAVCDHLDLQEALLQRLDANRDANLDANRDGRVAIRKVLWSSTPTLSSTPIRSADLQRAPLWNQQLVPDGSARSLITATVGPRVLTRLDDGSGGTSPERVAALWAEAGIRNSQQILQSLDFPLEERLSLSDLTLVLDNELLLSANSVHQAALISYRTEIQHLQEALEQASRERDKLRSDLDRADQQNLQLVREADDRHASMEALNQNRIRDLESDFRRRAAALRLQAEQENEVLLQQGERERSALRQELQLLRGKEAELQEELDAAAQEKLRLQQELSALQSALREADGSVQRLQTDLDQLLLHKLGGLDPAGAGLSHEERFCELLRESQRQCRELQDRNDELLEAQRSCRRSSRPSGGAGSQCDAAGDSDMRSIQSELALQQLKESHQEALQQLHIQLETQMNYYERQLDMMKQNMEVERKDICQAFKVEISELEEQKVQVEQQLKEALTRLQNQQGAGLTAEEQRRAQRERAELEQNYAREIGNLVQKLSAEKEQLEAELKLHTQQEVMRVREEEAAPRFGQSQASLEGAEPVEPQEVLLLRNGSDSLDRIRSVETALQEVLQEEQNRTSLLQEEVTRLGQENRTYMVLVDQLSSQIVEMEEELCSLSAPSRTSERIDLLQRALLDSQNQLSRTQQNFETEKRRLTRQLVELEDLVLELEVRTDWEDQADRTGPHRAQLEAVRSENAALQERLKVLQQTVQNLEDESEKRRRRQQEVEEERETSREEEEQLHRENSRYREEVLDLSGRNLQLSSDNGNLSYRLHSEQEMVRMLQECLATVTKEQEEEGAAVRRLEAELSNVKAELSRMRAELQMVAGEREELQKDREQQKRYAQQQAQQQAQQRVAALQAEAKLLAATQEKLGHAQEVSELHRKLREALSKVEEQQAEAQRLMEEKAELQQNLQTHRLTVQNQELQQQNLNQEQQNLKSRLDQAETARTQAEEQAQRADVALGVAKAQQLRRLQQLQEHAGGRQQLEQLQAELRAERGRSQQRQAQLELQLQQSRSQASLKQEQFNRAEAALQQRAAGLEAQLQALRSVLQDNVQQLKEQMERSNKTSSALKELHLQNVQLLAALQVTELRQKQAEKKNDQLEDKVTALGALLREVVAAAVTSS
ncbi:ninein-like protein isoform X2 [Xiphophorus couchianus]|uniref:ninein-like protein isoform X2 n=1 Tax=Xiphophorus couchianus TaxID=32473 RepID=UPI001016F9E3|nr:ninein-like protein isoform X2 [Xiphophorus couchianus]